MAGNSAMHNIRLAATVALLLTGCNPSEQGRWKKVYDMPDSAIYLDTSSLKRAGDKVTFQTKNASTKPVKVGDERAALLYTIQIDCTGRTFAVLDGELVLDGQRLSPLYLGAASGRLPPKGYMHDLAEFVC